MLPFFALSGFGFSSVILIITLLSLSSELRNAFAKPDKAFYCPQQNARRANSAKKIANGRSIPLHSPLFRTLLVVD